MTEKTGMANGRQMRFSDSELSYMRNTFKNNDELLKLLRKVFLPELDPTAPLGQMVDLWGSIPVKELSPEAAHINILARQTLISHLDQCIMQLQVLANQEETTPEDRKEKARKDSSK